MSAKLLSKRTTTLSSTYVRSVGLEAAVGDLVYRIQRKNCATLKREASQRNVNGISRNHKGRGRLTFGAVLEVKSDA
jgi:hypothetical protein